MTRPIVGRHGPRYFIEVGQDASGKWRWRLKTTAWNSQGLMVTIDSDAHENEATARRELAKVLPSVVRLPGAEPEQGLPDPQPPMWCLPGDDIPYVFRLQWLVSELADHVHRPKAEVAGSHDGWATFLNDWADRGTELLQRWDRAVAERLT